METIGSQKIWSFFDRRGCHVAKSSAVREGPGPVRDTHLPLPPNRAEEIPVVAETPKKNKLAE